jgi:O-antigen ligase
MSEPSPAVPRAAIIAAAALSLVGFAISVLLPIGLPHKPVYQTLPLIFVALLWLVPLGFALLRGERWAFIVAVAALMFLTEATFRSRTWADKSWDWQVVLKGLTWVGCGLVGAFHLGRTGHLFRTPPLVFVMVFVIILTASTAWSPTPSYTFQAAAGLVCLLLFAPAVAMFLDDDGLLIALAIGTGLIVLPSLAMSPFTMGFTPTSPGSTGESDRLRGLTDHPIPMAEISALFVFATASLWARRRGFVLCLLLAVLVVAGAVAAAMTRSRIPVMAMVAAALGYWSFRKGGALLMAPVLVFLMVLILAMESMAGFANLLPHDLLELVARSGSSKEILTLSGRLVIWPYVMERIHDAPLIGHGHASGMLLFKGFTPWKITHAHNAYLQSLLYVGVIGTLFLMLALATEMKVFLAEPRPVRDILLLNLLFQGMTEQSMVCNMPSQTVFLWMLVAAMAAMAWGKKRTRKTYTQ